MKYLPPNFSSWIAYVTPYQKYLLCQNSNSLFFNFSVYFYISHTFPETTYYLFPQVLNMEPCNMLGFFVCSFFFFFLPLILFTCTFLRCIHVNMCTYSFSSFTQLLFQLIKLLGNKCCMLTCLRSLHEVKWINKG